MERNCNGCFGAADGLCDTCRDIDLAGLTPAGADMLANAYQRTVSRTFTGNIELHALYGMAGEVGEIHSLYQKEYQGHGKPDPEHLKKEVGDLLWMVAEFCTAHGWALADVMRLNIEKTRARYPDGFSPENSLHRKAGDV